MKHKLIIIFLALTLFGCKEKETDPEFPDGPKETYMKTLLWPDTANPYKGDYYVHVSYTDQATAEKKELTYTQFSQNMTVWSNPVYSGLGMSIQGVHFSDSKTLESLEISFHVNTATDTHIKIAYADYYFSDPWRNFAGANINYTKPVFMPDSTNWYQANIYYSTNTPATYFKIKYIGNNRINGVFRASWKECCGGKLKYDVEGDFSIPLIQGVVKK